MGRSYTPTYRIEMRFNDGSENRAGWGPIDTKHCGRPTSAGSLARYCEAFNESVRAGANRHLGRLRCLSAKLVRQATGEVISEWQAELFTVVAEGYAG